jgi:hypothetical protein
MFDLQKMPILNSEKGVVPYLLAWLLGVPGVLLVVIYLLRH